MDTSMEWCNEFTGYKTRLGEGLWATKHIPERKRLLLTTDNVITIPVTTGGGWMASDFCFTYCVDNGKLLKVSPYEGGRSIKFNRLTHTIDDV